MFKIDRRGGGGGVPKFEYPIVQMSQNNSSNEQNNSSNKP